MHTVPKSLYLDEMYIRNVLCWIESNGLFKNYTVYDCILSVLGN